MPIQSPFKVKTVTEQMAFADQYFFSINSNNSVWVTQRLSRQAAEDSKAIPPSCVQDESAILISDLVLVLLQDTLGFRSCPQSTPSLHKGRPASASQRWRRVQTEGSLSRDIYHLARIKPLWHKWTFSSFYCYGVGINIKTTVTMGWCLDQWKWKMLRSDGYTTFCLSIIMLTWPWLCW